MIASRGLAFARLAEHFRLKSRTFSCQRMGRSTRPLPEELCDVSVCQSRYMPAWHLARR